MSQNQYSNLLGLFQVPQQISQVEVNGTEALSPRSKTVIPTGSFVSLEELTEGARYTFSYAYNQKFFEMVATVTKKPVVIFYNGDLLETQKKLVSYYGNLSLNEIASLNGITIPDGNIQWHKVLNIFRRIGMPFGTAGLMHIANEFAFTSNKKLMKYMSPRTHYTKKQKGVELKELMVTPAGVEALYNTIFQQGYMVLAPVVTREIKQESTEPTPPEFPKNKGPYGNQVLNVLTLEELKEGAKFKNKILNWSNKHLRHLAKSSGLELELFPDRNADIMVMKREISRLFKGISLQDLGYENTQNLTLLEASNLLRKFGLPYGSEKVAFVANQLGFTRKDGRALQSAKDEKLMTSKRIVSNDNVFIRTEAVFTPAGVEKLYSLMFQEGFMVLSSTTIRNGTTYKRHNEAKEALSGGANA